MIHQEMDIDPDWVFLPDNRYLDINQDGEKKVHGEGKRNSDTKIVFLTDYFDKEQPPSSGNSRKVPQQVVPVSFPLEPRIFKAPGNDFGKETIPSVPNDFTSIPSMIQAEKIKQLEFGSVEADKEVKTQVSFRKPTYNESVDMTKKLDSPKSTTRGVIPQIDAAGTFSFDDKSEILENKITSPRKKDLVEPKVENEEDMTWEENSGGMNLWKWSLTGIGAICSFGVAAATFCIILIGSQQRHRHQQQNQKPLFQRYNDDKRLKQVVRHATKLNDAISAARGVPITRAHITFGGYYDGI